MTTIKNPIEAGLINIRPCGFIIDILLSRNKFIYLRRPIIFANF
jgi:hypothetical protein